MVKPQKDKLGTFQWWTSELGGNHVYGVNSDGELVYRGDNSAGQLDVPLWGLAVGLGHWMGHRLVGVPWHWRDSTV